MVIIDGRKVIELEEGWSVLKQGITRLTNLVEGVPEQEFTAAEYSSLYTTAYNMASQPLRPRNYAAQLYDRYRESLEEYINSKVLPALRNKQAEVMLKELVRRWKDHKVMVHWLSRIFSYLERFYVHSKNLPTLTTVGVMCFRDLVYAEMKGTVKDAVIALINREREGEQIDQALVRNVVDIFGAMGMGYHMEVNVYEADFETFMLEDTSAFYETKASSWIQEDSCPVYMAKAEEYLEQERKRVGDYLFASSEQKLLAKVQEELLTKYKIQLLQKENSGCRTLLMNDKADDLSRMYRLFREIPKGLEPVAAIFRQHITEEGNFLIKQADDAAATYKKAEKKHTLGLQEHGLAFVQEALDLHDKYLRYVSECFVDHSLFHKALKEGFEDFCNKRVVGSTSAELLGLFCDNLLKKGGSTKPCDEEVEETLEKVMKILAHISDKDLFGEFCRKKLSKRLLFDYSIDHEWSIVSKLKQQYGGQFTLKMEGMLNDLEIAIGNQSNFKKFLTTSQITDVEIDLSVTVLTMSKWPTYKTSDMALPHEMVKCIEAYKKFYKTITNQRRLTWIYALGSCNIMGIFDAKPIELIVTTHQAVVLLLFNVEDRWRYNAIKNQMNLPHEDVVRLLHSLSCAKYKILNKDPDTKVVGQNDSFELNTKFTDKMRRIKIQVAPVDEKHRVIEDVDKNRRYTIDAAIVRIMKRRKQLPFQQLLAECVEQLCGLFKPDIKIVKKRVEDMISREFMERDSDNLNILKYVA